MTIKKYASFLAATALTGALPQIAIAQDVAAPDADTQEPAQQQGLQEIVVTAEKRTETALRTPISLIAMSEETLRTEGIATLGDIRATVPGLAISKFVSSPQTLQAYIRGQGVYDNQITFDPAVSANFNGVYIGRTAGLAFEIPGVERIEVLRGPQGTLYGRNATGGAINIVTAKPSLDFFSGEATVSYGNYNAFKASAALDIPVVPDVLGVRVAGLVTKRDGWVENTGLGEDFAKISGGAVRLDARLKPTDTLTVDYSYDLSVDNGSPPFIQNLGGDPVTLNGIEFGGTIYESRTESVEAPFALPHNEAEASGHMFTVEWKASDALTIRSISAWRKAQAIAYQQSAGGATPVAPFGYPVLSYPSVPLQPGMPGRYILQPQRQDDSHTQFSQELNFLGELFDGRVEYTMGLFYFTESGSAYQVGILGPGGLTHAIPLPRNSPLIPADLRSDEPGTVILNGVTDRYAAVENKSYAAFGQITITPPIWEDRLRLTVGGRYTRDEREATVDSVLTNTPPTTPLDATGKVNFNSFKPAVTLAADVAQDVNVYAKYATAFRSGGFNVRAIGNNDVTYETVNGTVTLAGFTTPFKPEDIESFEIGIKGSFLDRRLRLGLALYDSTVKNAQILNIAPNQAPTAGLIAPVRDVTNAGKMRARGIEFDAQALVMQDLQLSLNYSYFDGKYVDTLDPFGNDISKTLIVPFSPDHSVNAGADYFLDLGSPGTLQFHVGYSWVDDVASFPDRAQMPYSVIDSHSLLNASIKLGDIPAIPGLDVRLWGRNLTDTEYFESVVPGPTFTLPTVGQIVGDQLGFFAEPRTYGVEVRYTF